MSDTDLNAVTGQVVICPRCNSAFVLQSDPPSPSPNAPLADATAGRGAPQQPDSPAEE